MNRFLRLLFATALLALGASPIRAQSGFRVVAHSGVGAAEISREQATHIFLKKKTAWPNGPAASPVDQADDSPTRRDFSRAVLGKTMVAVKGYWQVQIFSGKATPPPERSSDVAVLSFVASTPGAIGYVSQGATLPEGVKEITVR